MKIYSHRSDKDIDFLRVDTKIGGVTLEFRRSGEEQTGFNPRNSSRITFDDTFEIDNLITMLTKLKEIAVDHYGDWKVSNGRGEYL